MKSDSHPNDSKTWYQLEEKCPFSQSLLWDLQQRYFAESGVEAWRQGEVPHYVTSNPTMANSYAEVVFAFQRDLTRQAVREGLAHPEPLTIVELGAGSGRFAFHLLKRLEALCRQMQVSPNSFRYVLTDFTQSNLAFWLEHPGFQSFFTDGRLDMALFDVNKSDSLRLQLADREIDVGDLTQPIIVFANYLFDSIPRELYHIQDGKCLQCLVTLLTDRNPETLPAAELLARLHVRYDYHELSGSVYKEPYLQALLDQYRRKLNSTHLFFPAAGLRCLERLKALSQSGLLLLSADKGDHRLARLEGKPPPVPVRHGSFSLNVNYHAFKAMCEMMNGMALFPAHHHSSLNVVCLLMTPDPADFTEARAAYQRHVREFSPDDFYSITKHARRHIGSMTEEDILAYLRLSLYDSHQFSRFLPRLVELAPEMSTDTMEAVLSAIEKVWNQYFPLGEAHDLADQIGRLLYAMDQYEEALTYFERSTEIYGEDSGTLYNMAACYQLLEKHQEAFNLLQKALKYDPENQGAKTLLAKYHT